MWRDVAKRFPNHVLVELNRYEAPLDAVEASVRSTRTAHGKPIGLSPFGWGEPRVEGNMVVGVTPLPVTPVRAAEPSVLAVAVLQYLALNGCLQWTETTYRPELHDEFYILLAMADRLVRRRLVLDVATAADLIMFCVFPPLAPRQQYGRSDFLAPILKLVEKNFSPPIPVELPKPLHRLLGQLEGMAAEQRSAQKKSKQRQSSTRIDKFADRVKKLLAERDAGGGKP